MIIIMAIYVVPSSWASRGARRRAAADHPDRARGVALPHRQWPVILIVWPRHPVHALLGRTPSGRVAVDHVKIRSRHGAVAPPFRPGGVRRSLATLRRAHPLVRLQTRWPRWQLLRAQPDRAEHPRCAKASPSTRRWSAARFSPIFDRHGQGRRGDRFAGRHADQRVGLPGRADRDGMQRCFSRRAPYVCSWASSSRSADRDLSADVSMLGIQISSTGDSGEAFDGSENGVRTA